MGPLTKKKEIPEDTKKKKKKSVPNVSRFNPANPFGFMCGTPHVGPLGKGRK